MPNNTINISINGKPFDVPAEPLDKVLTDLKFLQKWSAVEVSGEIIPRDELSGRIAQAGDQVEVVSPVGGGA